MASTYVTDDKLVVADNEDLAHRLDGHTLKEAASADAVEHQQTLREAFNVHKKAIFWSMALSAA